MLNGFLHYGIHYALSTMITGDEVDERRFVYLAG
jgi:hypothetical protein